MLILRRLRGLFSINHFAESALALAMALPMAAACRAADDTANAELTTYQRDGGETFFALCLTPPADLAKAQPPGE